MKFLFTPSYILRLILGSFLLLSLLLYNEYQPSFFDQFSITNSFELGVVVALLTGLLLDWIGYGAYFLVFCLVFIDFSGFSFSQRTLYYFLFLVNFSLLLSLAAPSQYLAAKFGGSLGYSLLQIVSYWPFRLLALLFFGVNFVFLIARVNKNFGPYKILIWPFIKFYMMLCVFFRICFRIVYYYINTLKIALKRTSKKSTVQTDLMEQEEIDEFINLIPDNDTGSSSSELDNKQ